MPPKGIRDSIDVWIRELQTRKHREAVKYIEENVDLIDTDLQKFIDDCPTSCQLEVCEMLLKAGIDLKEYVINDTLKKWDMYIHDTNPQFHQYYKIDYEKEFNDYIDILKHDWNKNIIVLDTLGGVVE